MKEFTLVEVVQACNISLFLYHLENKEKYCIQKTRMNDYEKEPIRYYGNTINKPSEIKKSQKWAE